MQADEEQVVRLLEATDATSLAVVKVSQMMSTTAWPIRWQVGVEAMCDVLAGYGECQAGNSLDLR